MSSYYNVAHGFIISSCLVGIQNGTLATRTSIVLGLVKDVQVGTEDDDNTDTTYDKVQIETFTLTAPAFREPEQLHSLPEQPL